MTGSWFRLICPLPVPYPLVRQSACPARPGQRIPGLNRIWAQRLLEMEGAPQGTQFLSERHFPSRGNGIEEPIQQTGIDAA
jgi:hypothetical protein